MGRERLRVGRDGRAPRRSPRPHARHGRRRWASRSTTAPTASSSASSLERIDHNFSRSEFGIFLGRRRGTGIGGDATRLALDWAFTILGLHNVMLESYDFNDAALRAYERAGFVVIGRRRDAVRALGRRWDSILMDATASGFESRLAPELMARRGRGESRSA